MQSEIIAKLNEERGALERLKATVQEQLRAAEGGIDRIDRAIEVLTGQETAARKGVSVVALLDEVTKTFGPGQVFDQHMLREKAYTLFPTSKAKLKTGVYGAVQVLVKKGKLVRCQGGFRNP